MLAHNRPIAAYVPEWTGRALLTIGAVCAVVELTHRRR